MIKPKFLLPILSATLIFALEANNSFAADHKVELINKSKWDIHELYFADSDTDSWGPDQLEKETIPSEQSFTLMGIPSGKYDIKIVDEDGDECIVEKVKLVESEQLELTDELLLGCQSATEAESEE